MIRFNPTTLDAEMVIGDTGTFPITPKINGEKFLDSGDTIWFTLRKIKDRSIIIQKEVKKFTDGTATIPILPSDTTHLDAGTYIYDLKLIRNSGEVDSLLPKGNQAYFVLKRGVK